MLHESRAIAGRSTRCRRKFRYLSKFTAASTSPRNSKGNIRSGGAEWERGRKNTQFSANKSPYLRIGAR